MNTITLQPMGRRIELESGSTILDASQKAGVEISSVCGGCGTCGKCKVKVVQGNFSPVTSSEDELLSSGEIDAGFRLACQTRINSDGIVHFPTESITTLQRLQLEGREVNSPIDPQFICLDVKLPVAEVSKKDLISLVSSVLSDAGYKNITIPEDLQRSLVNLRDNKSKEVTLVVNERKMITVLPTHSQIVGLAVDIGTTKIAGFLVDLKNGLSLCSSGLSNPQIAYGENVIDRIKFSNENHDGSEILQSVLLAAINSLVDDLCGQIHLERNQILDGVLVSNTVLHHMLLGLPLESLGTAPYTTNELKSRSIPARSMGIRINPNADIYIPSNIASFVGSDHLAVLASINVQELNRTTLVVDIGTNTEISLIHNGKHFCCSCASGPAFEGSHILHGMRAIPGAIEEVFIDDDGVKVQTINHQPAIGICGSGILDSVSELYRNGMIDKRGTFKRQDGKLNLSGGKPELILVDAKASGTGNNIVVTRGDVNQIQLAKAAIQSGIEVLITKAGISPDDIDNIYLAGAFGTYIDVDSALRIGMFPSIPIERFVQLGNAAGTGARELLVSMNLRVSMDKIAKVIEHVELVSTKGYSDLFMSVIGF